MASGLSQSPTSDSQISPAYSFTSPANNGESLGALQKAACLACRKRKIKCDKRFPCSACVQSRIQCGFMASNRTKSRSKVLSQLRNAPVELQIEMSRQALASQQTPLGLDLRLLSPALVKSCQQIYLQESYPINIIMDHESFMSLIEGYEEQPKRYALLAAICATAIYQCTDKELFTQENEISSAVVMSDRLIKASLRARHMFDYASKPDLRTVLTSFFLCIATFQQKQDTRGWFYLREACTLMQVLGMHLESTYKTMQAGPDSIFRWRLLYYLISVSERACSIHRTLPVTLDHSIVFPLMDNSDPEQRGFVILSDLFTPFDRVFSTYRDSGFLPFADPDAYVLNLHRLVTQACPDHAYFINFPGPKPFPKAIIADLLVNKQWLLIKTYHLAISQSLLTYLPPEADLGLLYPIKVARELLDIIELLGGDSFEIHGSSMLEKFYDIASMLADLVQIVPIPPNSPGAEMAQPMATPGLGGPSRQESLGGHGQTSVTSQPRTTRGFGPNDLLSALVKLVSQLRREHNPYLPLLMAKVHQCLQIGATKPEQVHRQPLYEAIGFEFDDLFLRFNSGDNTDALM